MSAAECLGITRLAALVWCEAAVVLAQELSQQVPTLLLVDDFGDFLHPALVHRLFEFLTHNIRGFQTLVVTHHYLPADLRDAWTVTNLAEDDLEDRLWWGSPRVTHRA